MLICRIFIDKIGVEIYNLIIKYNYIKLVKEKLISKYNITDKIFEDEVIPLIEELVNSKFLSYSEKAIGAAWMNSRVDISSNEKYPYNEIYISLADECNLNCIYCFNKQDRKNRITNNNYQKFKSDNIIGTLKEFKLLGGSGVIFTGGEPTLNDDLIYYCKEAKGLELEPHFITNGMNFKNLDLHRLFEYVDSFGISLDSIVIDELSTLWGKKNIDLEHDLYNSLSEINKLSNINKKIRVNLMPIVSKINIGSLDKLVQFVEKTLNKCEISWQMTQYSPIDREEIDYLLSVTDDEYYKAVSSSLKKTYVTDSNLRNKDRDDILINNKINAYSLGNSGRFMPPTEPKLLTCAPSFFIANNGDVYPCQGFEKKEYLLGNIKDDSLESLFSNGKFEAVRERVVVNNISSCSQCELRFVCTNKCGGCITHKENDFSRCKKNVIKRLYLQTQLS